MGVWTPVSYFSGREYPTESEARRAAGEAIGWIAPLLSSHPQSTAVEH